ncbi:MAG: hypothetical protein R3E08_04085 [Thiotrichaceae bacterium]
MNHAKSYTVANTRTSLEISKKRVRGLKLARILNYARLILFYRPNGTTYNSYLVRGSEGVAIIDTVKEERNLPLNFLLVWNQSRAILKLVIV